jgi:tetratricopeptide (TPR) repeat protein
MKTIAFYSYKGGVGRTLAIAHVAYWLSKQSKTVFMLDMDMEAPGLHYKLEQYNEPPVPEKGLVDFIGYFRRSGMAATSLTDYVIELRSKELEMSKMWLMPAGNPFSADYWKQLSDIEWKDFLYGNEKLGALLFLELKAHIEKAYNPDFLLIDCRTGLTDLTGIGLDLLADDAVVLGVNNPENIDGSRIVMEKLRRRERLPFKEQATRLHFVLTRIPAPKKEQYQIREERIKADVLARLNLGSGLESGPLVKKINVVHIDPVQALGERVRFLDKDWEKYPILKDYQELVAEITGIKVKSKALSFLTLLSAFLFESDSVTKSEIANKLVAMKSNVPTQEFERGYIAHDFLKLEGIALEAYSNAIRLKPDFFEALLNRGFVYHGIGDFDSALKDYNRCVELNSDDPDVFYNRGILLFVQREFDKAIADIQKTISLDPLDAGSYATLAEIYSELEDDGRLYENLRKALALDPNQLKEFDTSFLDRRGHETPFQALLQDYGLK